jgi:hypothetical protein
VAQPGVSGAAEAAREGGQRSDRQDLVEKLEVYYQLLTKWNAKINLTAFRLTPEGDDAAIDRLLIEPCARLATCRKTRGPSRCRLRRRLAGIPLKLASHNLALRMVEVKTRKAVFLREAVRELGFAMPMSKPLDSRSCCRGPSSTKPRPGLDPRRSHRNSHAQHASGVLRPGRKICCFRGASKSDLEDSPPPPLAWMATIRSSTPPLQARRPEQDRVDRLDVPRGTSSH